MKKKLIKRCKQGDIVERSDNTRVQIPRTDVQPIYYEPAALVERAIRKQPQAGSLTPVYPEFELLMGLKGLLGMPKSKTVRLYRGNAKNVQYNPMANGEAGRKYAGQWFTTDPDKPLWYLSNYRKGKMSIPVENLELQYVDIPEKHLSKFKAAHNKEIALGFDFEPEDYIIPLDIKRKSIPLNFDPAKYLQTIPMYQKLIEPLK